MASLKKRGNTFYAQYYVGGKQKRVKLDGALNLQMAKEKLRQLETSLYRGDDSLLPTKTPIHKVVTEYIEHMKTRKTARSVKRDIYYLREAFGPICDALTLKNAKISEKGKKLPTVHAPSYIEANCFEQITTVDISNFIATQVRRKGIKPKTANRFREILTRLYNWAMTQNGIKMPGDKNPASQVERHTESAPDISFLTLEQIDAQLKALESYPLLLTIVAVYIYAGLRREELCWLTVDDVICSTAGGGGMLRIRAKTIGDEYWEPKTKKNRVVPISKTLKSYLDSYSAKPVAGNWFFSTPTGKRWDPDNLSAELREVNKAAGLAWSCLDFRHTFGSQLAMKGESLFKISTIMGNSPEICRKHYAALSPESLIDSVEFGDTLPVSPETTTQASPTVEKHEVQNVRHRPTLRLVINNA